MTFSPHHNFPYTYLMVIAYDGRDYVGWQIQPQGLSIQGELKSAISKILQEEVTVVGSGRTDAGVHAMGQVAHFRCHQELDLNRFHHSLNNLLNEDIRVKTIEVVPAKFHAQFASTSKTYHYHLYLDRIGDPFRSNYYWHIRTPLSIDRLRIGAQQLVGTHNFSSFTNESNQGAAARNAVRTLYRLDIVEEEGGVRLELEANGFLYKMVRNIVGTLVGGAVDKTKRPHYIDAIDKILAAKDRKQAGKGAPPQGLFLVDVQYHR